MGFVIHLSKESFKFSCSHFTVLSGKEAEHLHGHNYQMRVALKISELDPKLGFAFDFNEVKPVIKTLCDEVDEKILLPQNSPYVSISKDKSQIEVSFQNRNYSFPAEDTVILPIANVTSEELARWVCKQLIQRFQGVPRLSRIRVSIEETKGQSVSYSEPI